MISPLNAEVVWAADDKFNNAVDQLFDTSDDSASVVQKWLRLYCAGKTKEAEAEWSRILKSQAKNCTIAPLLWSIHNQTIFLENSDKSDSRCETHTMFNYLLELNERLLGKDHRFIRDNCEWIAFLEEGRHHYPEAKRYRLRELALARKCFGSENLLTALGLFHLGHLELLMKDYADARPQLEKAVNLCIDHGFHETFVKAGRDYVKVLRLTQHYAEADAFMAKSKNLVWTAPKWVMPKYAVKDSPK